MADKTNYETGARKLMPNTGPDPSDQFSQDAAENRKPRRGGTGLSRGNESRGNEEQAAGNDRTASATKSARAKRHRG
jgi:hypothetical protein